MDWTTIAGIVLAFIGAIIFLYNVFVKRRFRVYQGIKEYKQIRDPLTIRDLEEEDDEEDDEILPEFEKTRKKVSIGEILGKTIGLIVSLYVFDTIIDNIGETINSTSSAFVSSISLLTILFPVIGILGVGSIILGALNASGFIISDKDVEKYKTKFSGDKGIKEYKTTRDTLTKRKKKNV